MHRLYLCPTSTTSSETMPAGIITALKIQEHDSQRVNVFIDGTFALGVSLKILAEEQLYVGKVLDAADWERLESLEQAYRAFITGLRYLEARPRSLAEVRARLTRKQFSSEAITAALTRLTECGLLDDVAFTRLWIENRQTFRPRGIQALRSELHHKGISREIIETLLDDTELIGDQQMQALTLARSVLHKYAADADYPRFQRRLGGYLQRRGFDVETIQPILKLLWHEVQAG